ncbi:MAG: hypothetical protein Q9162_005952 [Coniocarpon cinnabarinum]
MEQPPAPSRPKPPTSELAPHPDFSRQCPPDDPNNFKNLLWSTADIALKWISHATNEQLGACLVGLGASTYLVFGRVGLVLIGVVGGVVLHATWEGTNGDAGDTGRVEVARRKEVGLDVAQRLLDWRQRRSEPLPIDGADALGLGDEGHAADPDFSDLRPETATALADFADAVLRDYVHYWYSPVLPDEHAFPQTCRKILTNFITSLSGNLSKKRPADSFIEFTMNSSSIMIVFLNELSAALSSSPNSKATDAIDTYLRIKPQSNLSSIMDRKHQQRKLQMVADDILESFLDPQIYRTAVTRVFLQKILAYVVLEKMIERCSHAEWINEWIVYLLEDGEPELMNAIDAGVENSAAGQATTKPGASSTSILQEPSTLPVGRQHSRTVSRAEEAMDEAMREAKRLTQMIQEEEERRQQQELGQAPFDTITTNDAGEVSDGTTQGIQTPTSSQSEANNESQSTRETLPQDDEQREVESKRHKHAHSRSVLEGEQPLEAASPLENTAFTSFDQLGPNRVPTGLTDSHSSIDPEPLTLHKATIVLFDDSQPGDKKAIKSKPTTDYLIQIEPVSAFYPGWMIPRTYADFETLHEVLVRISKITGVAFASLHPSLPLWKGATKSQLKDELERYLADAMRFEQLAECEGMKRFLEKSRGMTDEPGKGFWPNPANMGKGMISALTQAPNQVAGGGKAFLGGVAGVFTGGANATNKRQQNVHASKAPAQTDSLKGSGDSSVDLTNAKSTEMPSAKSERLSVDQENFRRPQPMTLNGNIRPGLEPRRSNSLRAHQRKSPSVSPRPSITLERRHSAMTTASDFAGSPDTPSGIQLPPPPEEMTDEPDMASLTRPIGSGKAGSNQEHTSHMSADGTNFFDVPTPPTPRSPRPQSPAMRSPATRHSVTNARLRSPNPNSPPQKSSTEYTDKAKAAEAKRTTPLTEQEAQVTIELLFAVITELYTLSSAWTLRRTLLGAAKTFLLRPGNPQLESIRILLQEAFLDSNISDSGIAAHVRKMRENSLPTEAELATWPRDRNDEEKEALRVKARDLLVKRGMPQALTSVMGAAASGEALGKVFDCLQVQDVARGLMFGLCLQGLRTMTQ